MLGTRPLLSAPLLGIGSGVEESLSDIINIVDILDISGDYSSLLSDSLILSDEYLIETTVLLIDIIELTDSYNDFDTYLSELIVFSDSFVENIDYVNSINDALIILDTVEQDTVFIAFILDSINFVEEFINNFVNNLSMSDSFILTDNYTIQKYINLAFIDSLNLTQTLIISNIYEFALCDYINFFEIIGNQFNDSLTDILVITEPQREILQDIIFLIDEYITNMDNEDCNRPGGFAGESDVLENIIINNTLNCAMYYNIAISETINLYNTYTWRII